MDGQRDWQAGNLDPEEAVRECRRKARCGDAWAQLQLGLWLLQGDGADRRCHRTAMRWIRRSAKRGNAEAQCLLGRMLPPGRKARKWLRRAARRGHAEAQYLLARLYRDRGVDRGRKSSLRKAIRWARRAAEGGYADAYLLVKDCDLRMRMLP